MNYLLAWVWVAVGVALIVIGTPGANLLSRGHDEAEKPRASP